MPGASHQTREEMFRAAGIPGPPPDLKHELKWTTWLSQASQNPDVDILSAIGFLLEDFMDIAPPSAVSSDVGFRNWEVAKMRVALILGDHGLTYFPGGRVLRTGETPLTTAAGQEVQSDSVVLPTNIETLLKTLIRGLPRAMQPLIHRRKGAQALSFASEYDIQDLLHSLMRPWIKDIRPEESGPSLAGSGSRLDFLLPAHRLVIEVKRVRDAAHAKAIANELIIDVARYREHSECDHLWCVVYDPEHRITNQPGFITDIEKQSTATLKVCVFISAP
jgi:hypothetical protein